MTEQEWLSCTDPNAMLNFLRDADILNHCCPPGEHVRGCWIVDLILGKS